MRNIYEVIREKESEIEQLQKQVEALRVAARILSEDGKPEREPVRESGRPARNAVATPSNNNNNSDTEIVIGAPLRQFP